MHGGIVHAYRRLLPQAVNPVCPLSIEPAIAGPVDFASRLADGPVAPRKRDPRPVVRRVTCQPSFGHHSHRLIIGK